MYRAPLARLVLLVLLVFPAWSFSVHAADADWQLIATSKSAKVYFDRASLREDGDDVHYAVRVDLAEPREGKSSKVRYQSALSRFAVQGEIAQLFLERNAVDFERDAGGSKLENTEVAAIGRAITVLVACRKQP